MKLQTQKWLMVLAGGSMLALASFARAQSVTNQQPPLPPLPVVKSPVDAFRELLAMDSAAQRAALTNRSVESRQKLVEKIREYQRMDPDDRELRLVATELRWYLPQFMSLAASNRVARFADLRPDLREKLESRLTRWDALPEELRAQYLRNESALALLLHVGTASERLRQQLVNEVAPEMRATLNQALARLDAMSPGERARAFDVFENIFAMNPAEKAGALRVMSEAEQRQMEQTLAAFGQLTLEQRRQCLRSYEKFAGMNPDERALFLRNVQVWEKMSPKERQEWRELVKHIDLLPPLPERKISLPPLPPDPPFPRVTTNRT